MFTFAARDLAQVLETAQQGHRDVLTEPVLHDPSTYARTESGYVGGYRPMTRQELAVAQRFINRLDRQRDYQARKAAAEQRQQERLARVERAAHDENKLRSTSAAMARVAAASR